MFSLDEPGLRGRKILVVDDHAETRQLLVTFLSTLKCEVEAASGGYEALQKMAARRPDLVLLDLRMDDMDGLEVLRRARADNLAKNYTMMSGEGTVPLAVEAIRLGASDFLVKPFELETLLKILRRVLEAEGKTGAQDHRSKWRDKYAPAIRGDHESLLDVFLILERISDTDCTVLILGDSGTGKELVARAIHNASSRRKTTMVPVNCGAIPETLIESELFGHTKGAFSGATQNREGRFAAANNGTLFLDEIGEMSLAVQVKLLRVLQEGEYVPVGETRPRMVDVRIIAATNKNLELMAAQGNFREDLFYRLNLIPIMLPALRERKSDIPNLAKHFLRVFNERRSRHLEGFTDEALDLISQYPWPGNIRELENTVERMSLLHTGRGVLGADDLPGKFRSPQPRFIGRAQPPMAPALPGHQPPIPASSIHYSPLAAGIPSIVEPTVSGIGEGVVTMANDGPAANSTAGIPHGLPAHGAVEVMGNAVSERHAPIPPALPNEANARPRADSPVDFVLPESGINLRQAVELFEANLIDQALERTHGNKQKASELLQLNRTTLVEKLRKRERVRKRKEAEDRAG